MSLYVKKNGVVKKLAGVPRGWNAVKKFNVPATLWEANTDTTTSATYPYIAEITTDYFSDDSAPTWQMNGVGTLPTETELTSINMILDAIFLSTGVTLYATDQPTEDLVLETGMFVKGYSTSAAPAADISFDPSSTDLSSTNVQSAIVELKALITTPQYSTAGLTIDSDHVTINSGGYYVENGICYVDIVVTAAHNVGAVSYLVKGFPQASTPVPASGYTPVTGSFNNLSIVQGPSTILTTLFTSAAISTGTSVHFIGSYQIL